MSFWTTLFAIIGVVFIIALAYYLIRKAVASKGGKKKAVNWPSDSYMKTVGGLCPDYWVYGGPSETKGEHTCINNFNIPIDETNIKTNSCYDSDVGNTKTFRTVKKWPPKCNNLIDEKEKSICDWIDNCGPKSGIRASWVGMDKACSNC